MAMVIQFLAKRLLRVTTTDHKSEGLHLFPMTIPISTQDVKAFLGSYGGPVQQLFPESQGPPPPPLLLFSPPPLPPTPAPGSAVTPLGQASQNSRNDPTHPPIEEITVWRRKLVPSHQLSRDKLDPKKRAAPLLFFSLQYLPTLTLT